MPEDAVLPGARGLAVQPWRAGLLVRRRVAGAPPEENKGDERDGVERKDNGNVGQPVCPHDRAA